MTAPTDPAREDMARVLSEHMWPGEILTIFGEAWFICGCGERFDVPVNGGKFSPADVTRIYHRHVADALLADGWTKPAPVVTDDAGDAREGEG